MWRVHGQGIVLDSATISTITSLSGGALVANLIAVVLLIGDTLRQAR
jgi:hypothetical protein